MPVLVDDAGDHLVIEFRHQCAQGAQKLLTAATVGPESLEAIPPARNVHTVQNDVFGSEPLPLERSDPRLHDRSRVGPVNDDPAKDED